MSNFGSVDLGGGFMFFSFNFQPQIWGNDSHFDGCIFFSKGLPTKRGCGGGGHKDSFETFSGMHHNSVFITIRYMLELPPMQQQSPAGLFHF